MRVAVLGPLEVTVGGCPAHLGGTRLRTLLIRLALDPGRSVPVESLAHALWPEDGPDDPVHAVQSLVSRLRRALPGGPRIRAVPGGYRLEVAPEAVDAVRFERLVAAGRRALAAGDTTAGLDRLREALALWRGEPLADVAGAPFAVAAGARLTELRLAATEDRLAAELASGHGDPVAELAELVAAHPLRERLGALLVRALCARGRRAEALARYETFRRRLADELGADPGPELAAAYLEALRLDAVREDPPSRRKGNLRQALTSFVGRGDILDRLDRQRADGRLVTLVGPGGVGKTRLATAYAARLIDTVPGGAWLVEFGPVTDPGEVAGAVVGALGLRETHGADAPAPPPVERLVEAVSADRTVLVFDNCEHLVEAVARLAEELLGRCPRLSILATSREPLAIAGEALCPVAPLPVPEPDAPLAVALASPAVRLFADRAAAVRPGFDVTADTRAAVVEICRRLDGLPLAIELAAARVRALPVAEVAARLGDRFGLLTAGSRTAHPRHRTLRAVVDWSWQLLTAEERRCAEALAVFPATIGVAAAARVCDVPATAVLDLLAALVDRSLLQPEPGEEPRYRMLETIREYGRARLAAAGRLDAVRAAYTGFHLDLAEQTAPRLRGAGQLPGLRALAAERVGLAAALDMAADAGDADTAVRLAAALGLFWTMRGNHAEAAARLRRALEVCGSAPPPATALATAFYLLNAVLAGNRADPPAAVAAARSRPADGEHTALLDAMLALYDDAGTVDASHPDPWVQAMLRLVRSMLAGNAGDMPAMADELAAAVEAFRQAGERWGLATSLTYLALTEGTLGAFDRAVPELTEAILLLDEMGDADTTLQRVWLAQAHIHTGDTGQARTELTGILASGADSPTGYQVLARIALGNLARYDGELAEAERQYAAARADLERVPAHEPLFGAMLYAGFAQLRLAGDRIDDAGRHLATAYRLAGPLRDLPVTAMVGVAAAWLRWQQGVPVASAELLGAAHALRGAPDAANPDVASLTARLTDALGPSGYRTAYEHGRGLDRAAATALIGATAQPVRT